MRVTREPLGRLRAKPEGTEVPQRLLPRRRWRLRSPATTARRTRTARTRDSGVCGPFVAHGPARTRRAPVESVLPPWSHWVETMGFEPTTPCLQTVRLRRRDRAHLDSPRRRTASK